MCRLYVMLTMGFCTVIRNRKHKLFSKQSKRDCRVAILSYIQRKRKLYIVEMLTVQGTILIFNLISWVLPFEVVWQRASEANTSIVLVLQSVELLRSTFIDECGSGSCRDGLTLNWWILRKKLMPLSEDGGIILVRSSLAHLNVF